MIFGSSADDTVRALKADSGELAWSFTTEGPVRFAPHIAGLHASRDQSVTVMGQQVSMPVIISPTGVQAVHPDGEVAVARAARKG